MDIILAVKVLLGTWFVVGTITALGGLAWTFNISSRLLKDQPKSSSFD